VYIEFENLWIFLQGLICNVLRCHASRPAQMQLTACTTAHLDDPAVTQPIKKFDLFYRRRGYFSAFTSES